MITKKQKQILDFIVEYIFDYQYSPSYREIGRYFGFTSTATVYQYVQTLIKKGYLEFSQGEPRSLRPTNEIYKTKPTIELPLVGLITAGEPIEAVEERETIAVPHELVRDINSFVLKVKGNSMIEDGILDGDYVIVERNYYPQNGDVVVALLDNAYATLKKYYREKNRIRLQPANSRLKPIFVKNPAIQGIVRGVFRLFQPA